jgi:glycosyltransferase involved in cell wall biosynthesis
MDVVIACNPEIERECREDVGLPEEKVRMIPAFIPVLPDRIQEPPDYIRNFHDTHDPVISSVGWVGQTYQGADIYGLDMLIELVERLRGDYPRLGLVMSVNGGKPEAVEQFVEECRRRVGSSMLLITESLEDISAIFRDSDLFVRPTNTDGDAVSIREALFLGTPVVASDAVPRPEPCVLFKSRDMDDFGVKVREALDCREELTQRIAAIEMEDNGKELIRLYEQVLKGTD